MTDRELKLQNLLACALRYLYGVPDASKMVEQIARRAQEGKG